MKLVYNIEEAWVQLTTIRENNDSEITSPSASTSTTYVLDLPSLDLTVGRK